MGDVQQNNTTSAGIGAASVTVAALHSAARAANKVDSTSASPNIVKGVLGFASFATLAAGLRSAWKHTRQPEAADLRRAQVLSGVGFASKALGVATIITVSGFSLFIVGISWVLNVNTPRQFGSAMCEAFGDSLRLPQSQNSQTFEELILSIEAQQQSNLSTPPSNSAVGTGMLTLCVLLTLLFLVILLLFSLRSNRPLPIRPSSKVLLVIAHPDDETMFFAPTLRALSLAGHRIFMLCVSNGNYEGLGRKRTYELRDAVYHLGVSPSDVTVLDYDAFQDGEQWDKQGLGCVLLRHMEVLSVDLVLSFDTGGVSGHRNHSSCFEALQEVYTRGVIPEDVQIFVLDSVSLFRKYLGIFDAPFSVARSPFHYFARGRDVAAAWRAMHTHRSQFVWFRFLYMIFSRYVYINTFRRIAPVNKIPVAKRKCKSS
ncbi:N-acetylglucosaminyl-phosphatidylinositol de-N-acetylase domain protein [Necator americanus]|uniref:N-acetylglucosaminylphosphatidylinositol deacetylase n=1 Tax=Necator americanus TaxID=51031 RepID=W2TJK1_NECAM|nr:N-acetylglucosaminyl-phosphatidylinositol de-N-acetylase domain protein [Necator americanus]ETN81341.1 N-acetylglucosaminyl-phosphatidylinositol de-N-acetylase domain protein [Necator americanus]